MTVQLGTQELNGVGLNLTAFIFFSAGGNVVDVVAKNGETCVFAVGQNGFGNNYFGGAHISSVSLDAQDCALQNVAEPVIFTQSGFITGKTVYEIDIIALFYHGTAVAGNGSGRIAHGQICIVFITFTTNAQSEGANCDNQCN